MKYTSKHIREGNLIMHHNPEKEERWPAKIIVNKERLHLGDIAVGYLYSDDFDSKKREYWWNLTDVIDFLNDGTWILIEEVSNNYEVYE